MTYKIIKNDLNETNYNNLNDLNETKADSYIAKNSIPSSSTNLSLQKSVSKTIAKLPELTNSFCSTTGIALSISSAIPFTFHVSISASELTKLALNSTRETLYSYSINVLAGLVLSVYSKHLFFSTNKTKAMDNSILSTASKFVLVELLSYYPATTLYDFETLPHLDISYETHLGLTNQTNVKDFDGVLTNYLASLKTTIASYSITKEEIRKASLLREELQKEINKNKKLERDSKNTLTSYEVARLLAKKSLSNSLIDLYYMNYKKLCGLMELAVSTGGASNMSKEVKDKIIFRLDEISTKVKEQNEVDFLLLDNIKNIKTFIIIANSEKVSNFVTSSLERASDASIDLTNKKVSLLERLKAIKASQDMKNKENS